MTKKILFFTVGVAALAFSSSTTQAGELLINGNFETPAQTTLGAHDGVAPGTWIVGETAAATTTIAADSDIQRGTVTNGTGVTVHPGQDLPTDPNDPTGLQALDGVNKAVFVIQSFTLGTASPLAITIDFGGRDSTSADAATPGSTWQLLNSGGTQVAASPVAIKPATGTWATSKLTTALLPAGTYKFIVSLDNPDLVDAASITTVPEPTTFTLAGLGVGLLGWLGCKRRQRS